MNKLLLAVSLLFPCSSVFAGPACGGVKQLFFSPDNRYFAALWGDSGNIISFGTYKDRKFHRSVNLRSPCLYAISPDSKRVAASLQLENKLLMLSLNGEMLQVIEAGSVLAVSKKFNYVATSGSELDDRILTVHSFSGGRLSPVFKLSGMADIGLVEFSPDERFLAYEYSRAANNGRFYVQFMNVIDLKTGRSAAQFSAPDGGNSQITALYFSPDSKMLVYGSEIGTVRLLSAKDWKTVRTIKGSGPAAAAIRISNSGAQMAVMYWAGTREINIYSMPGFKLIHSEGYGPGLSDIEFSHDSKELGVLFSNGKLNFLNLGRLAAKTVDGER